MSEATDPSVILRNELAKLKTDRDELGEKIAYHNEQLSKHKETASTLDRKISQLEKAVSLLRSEKL